MKRAPLVGAGVARVGDAITDGKEFAGEITLSVATDRIREVATAFKEDGFNYLVDLTGVDYSKYPGWTKTRYGVAYMLYSFSKNARIRLKVFTDGVVPTVTSVWTTANWHERETFDMM